MRLTNGLFSRRWGFLQIWLVVGSWVHLPPSNATEVRPSTAQASAFADQAATEGLIVFKVAVKTDAEDDTPGDGHCRSMASGACTLRAAIQESNALPGLQVIRLPKGAFVLTHAGANENDGKQGDLDITDSITLQGAGRLNTSIDGGRLDRVLHVRSATANGVPIRVTLTGLTIRNGETQDGGGGMLIEAGADVAIQRCSINNNRAVFSALPGGGIATYSDLRLWQSEIRDNYSDRLGGGIAVLGRPARVRVLESMIRDNQAGEVTGGDGGGGIVVSTEFSEEVPQVGGVWIERSTLTGNRAGFGGAILHNCCRMPISIRNSTISGNQAQMGGAIGNDSGGQITLNSSTVTLNIGGGIMEVNRDPRLIKLQNTILAGNIGSDCTGTLSSLGHNLFGRFDQCFFMIDSWDRVGWDPKLEPLADNGGATLTHALQPGSPAIDLGQCPPAVDQRGITRGLDGDGDGLSDCDIGAYEFIPEDKSSISLLKAED